MYILVKWGVDSVKVVASIQQNDYQALMEIYIGRNK